MGISADFSASPLQKKNKRVNNLMSFSSTNFNREAHSSLDSRNAANTSLDKPILQVNRQHMKPNVFQSQTIDASRNWNMNSLILPNNGIVNRNTMVVAG